MKIKAIVTDIEGTTTSLSFVKDVLFPYARQHIEAFIKQNAQRQDVEPLLQDVNREAGRNLSIDEAGALLVQWIDADKKITPLKALQGLIWEDGYRNGDFHGHVYQDAYECLKKWQQRGIKLYVYSSGSVYAQKLLFAHTEFGDLTELFSGYFDTQIGHKQETQSYQTITTQLDLPAEQILFLSDIKGELDAAREAGMQTIWSMREGKSNDTSHPQVSRFDEIDLH